MKATKPANDRRSSYHDGKVEVYDQCRFFTVTGDILSDFPQTVEANQAGLEAVLRMEFSNNGPPKQKADPGTSTLSDDAMACVERPEMETGRFWGNRTHGPANGAKHLL